MANRPADVRFYFDADILGVAKIVAGLRYDVTYPGDPGAVVNRRERPACSIRPGALDSEWIPVVAQRRWLAVTRDAAIQRHPSLRRAAREYGARIVALSGPEATGTWAQLEVLMSNWRRLEGLLEAPGPHFHTMTRTSMTELPLD